MLQFDSQSLNPNILKEYVGAKFNLNSNRMFAELKTVTVPLNYHVTAPEFDTNQKQYIPIFRCDNPCYFVDVCSISSVLGQDYNQGFPVICADDLQLNPTGEVIHTLPNENIMGMCHATGAYYWQGQSVRPFGPAIGTALYDFVPEMVEAYKDITLQITYIEFTTY